MAHRILLLDIHPKHQQVMRHYIERMYPRVKLDTHDPQSLGMPGKDFAWTDYDLLLMDNQLGEEDAMAWLQQASQQDGFPAFVILSSASAIDQPETMESVVGMIRLGAINFHFKKNMQLDKLNIDIGGVLEKAPERPEPTPPPPELSTQEINQRQTTVKQAQDAVEDTQHEINLAMAMLNGHSLWPFSMEDILSGQAYVGDYKVLSYLGSETAGATFRVRHKGHKQPLIMYYVNTRRNEDGSIPQPLIDELEVMKSLDHPNVLAIQDYQLHDDAILVIRDMVLGDTLAHRLNQQGMHTQQAIGTFRQILSGLQELHQHQINVEHFTPRSLRIDHDDQLVFADTGLLHRLHAINEVTGENFSRDLPMYATPEQVQGRKLDHRSDLYIAGLIGYEMIAGKPVFSVGSVKDILYAHVAEPVPDLPDSDHWLNSLFQEMLEKTPSRRIQSAADALARLDGMMNSAA